MNLARDWWQATLTWRGALLLPLSWIYGGLVRLRRLLLRAGWLGQSRLAVPVVVVGNITVGGSGKTPLVIHLAQALRARGHNPGVISRGYGSSGPASTRTREVTPASPPQESGDEPLLIRRRADCPVVVGASRVDAGRVLLAAYPGVDVIIADDGLQHLQLARDFEIAVFDQRGCGNGQFLPAGPLREPVSRLRSVDAVVAQDGGSPVAGALPMSLEFGDFHALDDPSLSCPPQLFASRHGAAVAALAGIGNPGRFFSQLRKLGLAVEEHPFPDHHAFTAADLARIGAPIVLMTEKDALKCVGLGARSGLWVAPVSARISDALVDTIVEKLLGSKAA